MRMTKAHLLDDFERLKKRTDLNLEIEWSGVPHRPRIFKISSMDDISHLSPRLSLGDMHLWIETFNDGFDHGWDAHTNFSL